MIENNQTDFARLKARDLGAIAHERRDDALGLLGVVAKKFARPDALADGEPDGFRRRLSRARPCLARLGALALHGDVESLDVDADAARAQGFLREIEGKPVRVIKLERGFARQARAAFKAGAFLVEDRQATRQRDAEARFLET